MNELPVIQRVIAVLWPSFLTGGIATVLLTTAFDPVELFVDYDISRTGLYTMIFFLFWLQGIVTSVATCFFMRPCSAVNKKETN